MVRWKLAFFAVLLTTPAGVALAADATTTACREGQTDDNTFDFVVVGAGAAGGVLASRLAEEGYVTLLLEAGPDYDTDLTQVPAFWAYSTQVPQIAWDFTSQITPNRTQESYPRGSMVGGSAMHNAMIAMYSFPQFWNQLADITGDAAFAEDTMRTRFHLLERNEYIDNNRRNRKNHGFEGYISTSLPDTRLVTGWNYLDFQLVRVLTKFVLDNLPHDSISRMVCNFLGLPGCLPLDADVNAPGYNALEGAHISPSAVSPSRGYQRSSSYNRVQDVKAKPNSKLIVKPHSFVTKLLLEGTDVYGVEVQEGTGVYGASLLEQKEIGDKKLYFARREVVLSAGTFNTPQILMLSGIGPQSELEKFDIPTVVDLPGVGSNLRDKLEVTMNWKAKDDWKIYEQGCTFRQPTPEDDPCLIDYLNGKFPNIYSSSGTMLAVQKKSNETLEYPDFYVQILLNKYKGGYYKGWVKDVYSEKNSFLINMSTTRKGPPGTVKLRSADPLDAAKVDFNGFDEKDVERSAKMAMKQHQWVQELIEKEVVLEQTFPDPTSVKSFQDYKQWVRDHGWGHHPLGTAKMGSDDDVMAVVNGQFQVRGINNLRIVDASVFPDQPGFFPTIPIYMLAEKAAQDILPRNITTIDVVACGSIGK